MTPAFSNSARRKAILGFSLVELVTSLAILMILSAIAIPTLMRAYRSYVLSDIASRFSGTAKLTRFEAIRKNTQISFRLQQAGTNWNVWVDSNGNGTPDSGEPQVVLTGLVVPLPSGSVPSSAPISAANGSATLSVLSGGNTSVTYDGRGAIYYGPNPTAVYVFYFGNTSIPNFGSRAVVLLPSGIVQVWTSGTGTWQRLN